jgi:hypothetical protein
MRPRSRTRRLARGFALVALLALLAAGVLYFVVTSLSPQVLDAYRTRKTQEALATARDALVGYALQYRDQQLAQTTPVLDAMYGHLPMPDLGETTNKNGLLANAKCTVEGCAKQNNSGTAADTTYIGRFPWRTLGLEPLRDGYGECLWYVVSGSHKDLENTAIVNWDTLGQLDVVVATSANTLVSVLASPHNQPVAVIFSPGPPLPGQDRSPASAGDDVTECGGNYDAANYLDPGTAGALAGVANFGSSINNHASENTGTANKSLSLQGAIQLKSNGTLWPNACPAGTDCALVANDTGLALNSDMLFGALRKNANFRVDISSLLDRIVGCLRDEILASTGPTGYAKIADDPPTLCYSGNNVVPRGYYLNYKNMIFVARGAMSVNGAANCNGVVLFSSQRGTKNPPPTDALESTTQLRTPDPVSGNNATANTDWPANYLEGPDNLASFTGSGTTFSGPDLFQRVAASRGNPNDAARCLVAGVWKTTPDCQTAEQDIVRCIPNSASLASVNSPDLINQGFAPLAGYDPGTRTLTLGAENVTTTAGAPAADLFGCAWIPEANTQGKGFRAYFTFQFNKLGTGVGNTGFAFAAIDAESNVSLPCGASGSHLGYSGNNGVTPRLASPKIGIEFDQSRNTGFSEGSGNPGRNDPCGTSGCGGTAGYNSHSAIVYWGHETANATDGVTLPNDDDNVHGFPTIGSESFNLKPPPQNPSNVGATPPGIAFVDMRGQSGGNSYLYHVRVEITPISSAVSHTLANARVVAIGNVNVASPGGALAGLSDGDRVLLAGQVAPSENGLYVWHDPASPMTRPSDADSGTELTQATIQVAEGTSAGSTWRQTLTIATVDVDPQSWQLSVQDFKTEVWIDHGSGTPLITAMEDTTRPMAQLAPAASPTLRDTSTIYGVAGAACGTGCPSGQTCGLGNRCFRQPMKSIRLGFTGSQWTQDEQVVISNFFASWLQ